MGQARRERLSSSILFFSSSAHLLSPPVRSPPVIGAHLFSSSSRPTCFNNGGGGMAEGERENGRFEASKEQTDQGWFLFDSAVMANGYTHKQHRHPTPPR